MRLGSLTSRRNSPPYSACRLGFLKLSEVDHGDLSGLTNADIAATWPEEARKRARDKYSYHFPGGESYADARAARALARIGRLGARAPLLVSHEMIGRMLLKNLAGPGSERALRLRGWRG